MNERMCAYKCVCVCVCVREREREGRYSFHGKTTPPSHIYTNVFDAQPY